MNKKRLAYIMVCLLLLYSSMPLSTGYAIRYDNYSGFTVGDQGKLPSSEIHPKLWFGQDQLGTVYAKREADSYAASLWNSIAASSYLTADFPAVPACPPALTSDAASSIHRYYGDMARFAKYNAFMYIMQGNGKYLTRATDALKRAYDGPIYSCSVIGPLESSSPVDETYRANWAQNYAAAYDWVHNALSADDDAWIRQRLANEAQVTSDNLLAWGPRNHNHRSKPAWGLGSMALALSSHPSASTWLDKAIDAFNTNTSYYFSEDGLYREGSHYYIYSLINFVPFLYNYKNVSGMNYFPLYRPAFQWELYTSNNKGWMPNFEDSYLHYNFLGLIAGQYMSDDDKVPVTLHPDAKWGNIFQWRYQNTDKSPWSFKAADGSLVDGEFGNNTGASLDDTMDIDKYLTYDPKLEPIAPTGSGTQFLDKGGETVFRNNWLYNDPSSRYLNFHAVAETDNHNHFDTLSFSIHAENQMMASTSGYSRSAYGDEIRRSWYRTAEADNMVTMDVKDSRGVTQQTWPVEFEENVTPVSKYNIDTDYFDFQQKEARFVNIVNDTTKSEVATSFPPDSESLGYIKRSVAFPGQDYFVVIDQLSSKSGAAQNYNLYLHGGRGAMTGSDNHRLWTYEADNYGAAAKFSTWIFSNGATLTDKSGELTYIKGDYANFGYVQARKNAVNTNFMQILIPLGKNTAEPKVTELSDSTRVGGTVVKDGNLDTFLVQQGTGVVALDQLTTDADFGYARENGSLQHWAARQATTVSYKGIELFSSTDRITLSMDLSKLDHSKATISTNASNYAIKIKNPFGKTASKATWVTAAGITSDIPLTSANGYTQIAGLTGGGDLTVSYTEDGEPDNTAPAAIVDLAVTAGSSNEVNLSWTSSGDDENTGTADYYDFRYSMSPITEQNWAAAVQVTGEPAPATAGTKQSMKVRELSGGATYYFAMKTFDKAGNGSKLSNTVSSSTQVFDLSPVKLSDFAGNPVTNLVGGVFVSAKVDVSNRSLLAASAQLVIALYKTDHTLIKTVNAGKMVNSGDTDTFQVGMLLPDALPNGSMIKVFVWDGSDTLEPLSNVVTFPY
ncbi:heparinase II/III domain-containing protein [Paenibacillus radicis (ex Xue et al. 2023)]|uniref:Heparinase II/III family protein n=1 Tax=Paenibacillus radicis (ex Xue et al. 2023) TaxID=2972489 RepID=A0ABT1YTX4_9BACL|nr:heparinase II/III family protein [Paenibacillus radicis (ex Xue et al. 2023)]MCR8636640.1 heparinase II/III family protein [Paenibacillus radicis (ex Xue et al. 2023)]